MPSIVSLRRVDGRVGPARDGVGGGAAVVLLLKLFSILMDSAVARCALEIVAGFPLVRVLGLPTLPLVLTRICACDT